MKVPSTAFVVVFLLLTSSSVSQIIDSRHTVYAELAGNGIPVSANYDYLHASGFGARIGVGLSGFDHQDGISVPATCHYILGDITQVEFGLGVVFRGLTNEVFPVSSVAFRYHPNESGMFYRFAVNPLVLLNQLTRWGFSIDRTNVPPVSLGIGYTL
jgi:hypothetical protein